ncbi:FTH domain-containing protein [Caenorhabditis elegans]|uniref:FTH domain-containing protein n=1 Tax=Caenorhabditis elegans TaxID=6239 RepID=Q7YXC4_CAEEL|nr:FTH domain-containing protein [Caenorhabditis elegans]CAD91711.1 FTH domain-containing protein [Caenorhabditis elegans]|eukprot:NP_001022891.1 Uncharacterized protein CELE_Y48A6C.5 [Caenorhabditis elegans]
MNTPNSSCTILFENLYDNDLALKLFNNRTIVDNILRNVKGDINNRLELRLVNKSFNLAAIHVIRKENRTVVFHKFNRCDRLHKISPCPDCSVHLNSVKLNKKNIFQYARFLKQTMKIMVIKIRIEDSKRVCCMITDVHQVIHKSLIGSDYDKVEEFVGIDQISFSTCIPCEKIAANCKVFGPVQNDMFNAILRLKHHYDVLQVKDMRLYKLMILNKEDPTVVEDFINSNITCSKLTIFLMYMYEKEAFGYSLPREFLDLLIKKWNVKTVEIVPRQDQPIPYYFHCNTDFIVPKAKFYVDYWTQPRSKYTLDGVEIDLQLTKVVEQQIKNRKSLFDNFIANARRIFPSNKITVRFSKEVCQEMMSQGNVEDFISGIILMTQKDAQPNSHISLKLYPEEVDAPLIDSFLRENFEKKFDSWNLETVSDSSANLPAEKCYQFFNQSTNCKIIFYICC